MTTALVTGANGAIGQTVVRELAGRRWSVVGLGHGAMQTKLPMIGHINGEIDASNLSTLAAMWGRPQLVIHLAGGSSVAPSLLAPAEDFARTAASSVRLLEWLRVEAPEAAIVLASSAAVYGHVNLERIPVNARRLPVSPYGYHKAMMEQAGECWASNFGLRVAILRLFSVYGPTLRKQLVWELCVRLARGETSITLGGTGGETRDWVHVDDAARMLIDAGLHAATTAPIFNGCTGRGISVSRAAELVAGGFGRTAKFRFSGERRPGDPSHLVGEPDRASDAGIVSTVAAEDGLAATARIARSLLLTAPGHLS